MLILDTMYFVKATGLTRVSSSITILLVVLATVSATIMTDLGALSVATQNNSLLYRNPEAGDMTVTYRQLATNFEKAMAKCGKVTNATISGRWNYCIGKARSYIVNTLSSYFGSSDVIHTITDCTKPCNTHCFTIKENGYYYNFCFYVFTKYGNSCSFYNTEDLIDATVAAIQDQKISYRGSLKVGSCATIYKSGSSVIYVKWKLSGSDVYFENIWCEGVEGWGVPSPNVGNTGTNC
ncbi:hypothetical protein V1525DRAFT_162628 [Lipomyces kononenkoae]|uniref:Uncharacterized protein n=1 Tax=Lipomyces kononenkoae TaxID=34357 RepID=A0ACC3T0S7_LIPKO